MEVKMDNLKTLLGSAYHDDITVAEINTYLDGKKLVDLKSGEYIAKEKFTNLEVKYKELSEKTKDHDTMFEELKTMKAEKEVAETRKSLLEAGIDEKYLDYVQFQIEKGVIVKDDKLKDNVKAFVEKNPQYGSQQVANPQRKIVINTNVQPNDGTTPPADNKGINDAIRSAAGKQQ